jgi:hypothetical protein
VCAIQAYQQLGSRRIRQEIGVFSLTLFQVMYSYCLSNTMAGKSIEVETIMATWSCYISTCELPYEVNIFLLGLA